MRSHQNYPKSDESRKNNGTIILSCISRKLHSPVVGISGQMGGNTYIAVPRGNFFKVKSFLRLLFELFIQTSLGRWMLSDWIHGQWKVDVCQKCRVF